eukprot:6352719-Karenia_brevis.AAC.1
MASMHARENRAHGDVFPMGLQPLSAPLIQVPRYLRQRRQITILRQTRVNEAILGLNDLAAATVEKGLSHFRAIPARHTATQQDVLKHVARTVSSYGAEPKDLSDAEALKELLKSRSVYGDPHHLAEFEFEKLRVATAGDVRPKDAASLLPP